MTKTMAACYLCTSLSRRLRDHLNLRKRIQRECSGSLEIFGCISAEHKSIQKAISSIIREIYLRELVVN